MVPTKTATKSVSTGRGETGVEEARRTNDFRREGCVSLRQHQRLFFGREKGQQGLAIILYRGLGEFVLKISDLLPARRAT